jgi:hypothetical protein
VDPGLIVTDPPDGLRVGPYRLGEVRKAAVAVATLALTGLSLALDGGLLPEAATPYVLLAVNLAGAYGVYRLPNTPRTDDPR